MAGSRTLCEAPAEECTPEGSRSSSLMLEPPPLSEEGMRIVLSLQEKLRRTQRQLREAELTAEGATEAAEEGSTRCGSLCGLQDRLAHSLQRARFERCEDARLQRSLAERIRQCGSELAAARARRESLVHPAEHEAARQELQGVLGQLTEAEREGRELRARLVDAEASQRKQDRRLLVLAKEEAERRQTQKNPRGILLERAAELSARVAAERQARDLPRSQELLAQLGGQREQLEQELQRLCRHNLGLEQRLETLRTRNRQLEAQHRRTCDLSEEQESALRAELRRRAQPLRVLAELVREDSGDRPDAAGPACAGQLPPARDGAATARSACAEELG